MTEYWDLLDENREPLGMLHRRGAAGGGAASLRGDYYGVQRQDIDHTAAPAEA